jgi:hypothetical protein
MQKNEFFVCILEANEEKSRIWIRIRIRIRNQWYGRRVSKCHGTGTLVLDY